MHTPSAVYSLPVRLLDRANVRVARWRLKQDNDRSGGPACSRAPATGPFRQVGAERLGGRDAETWRLGSGDWLATRLPADATATPRSSLVLLHGWLATPGHMAHFAWRLRPLLRSGVDVWLPRLPYHLERTPRGAVSGSRCLTPDAHRSAEVIRLAAAETNRLGEWLAGDGARVGLWGVSLGGWVAGVAVTRSECWDAVVLWSAVTDPVDALEHSPLAAAAGIESGPAVTRAWKRELIDVIPAEQVPAGDLAVLVISGQYDNVARASTAADLARRWSSRIELLRHGHISMVLSPRAWEIARTFVREVVVD